MSKLEIKIPPYRPVDIRAERKEFIDKAEILAYTCQNENEVLMMAIHYAMKFCNKKTHNEADALELGANLLTLPTVLDKKDVFDAEKSKKEYEKLSTNEQAVIYMMLQGGVDLRNGKRSFEERKKSFLNMANYVGNRVECIRAAQKVIFDEVEVKQKFCKPEYLTQKYTSTIPDFEKLDEKTKEQHINAVKTAIDIMEHKKMVRWNNDKTFVRPVALSMEFENKGNARTNQQGL